MTKQQQQQNEEEESNNANANINNNNKGATNTSTTTATTTKGGGLVGLGGRRSHYKMSFGSSSSSPSKAAVRFAAATKKQQNQKKAKTTSSSNNNDDEQQLIPQKIKVKVNPIRDIGLFLSFIIFMFLISFIYKDVGKAKTATDVDYATGKPNLLSARTMARQFQKAIQTTVMTATGSVDKLNPVKYENIHDNQRSEDCNLFLHKTTIPMMGQHIGLSFFAGKNFSVGDDIMNLGQPILIDIPTTDESSSSSSIQIPPLALLLKHHPILHNVKPSHPLEHNIMETTHPTITLQATQPIIQGQELFLSFDDHLVSSSSLLLSSTNNLLFQNIPTQSDYDEADAIIREERILFKVTDSKKRTTHYKKRIPEIGIGLRSTQKAVMKYAPRVAALLPIMADQLLKYDPKSNILSALQSLKNYTYDYMIEYGVCISDIDYINEPDNDDDTDTSSSKVTTVVIQNKIKIPQGKRIVPIPLYVTTTKYAAAESSSSSSSSYCLYHQYSTIVICPMIQLEYSSSSDSNSSKNADKANTKLQWSIWNPINATKKEPDVILEKYATELSWDAIALTDLEPGEKIVVSVDKDPITGMLLIPNELFPEKWITAKMTSNDEHDENSNNNNGFDNHNDEENNNDQDKEEEDVEQRLEL